MTSGGTARGGCIEGTAKGSVKLIFSKKKLWFPSLNNFNLLSEIQGDSINLSFQKFIISVEGGHCDYSPRELLYVYTYGAQFKSELTLEPDRPQHGRTAALLSPSSILPPPSSYNDVIPTRKNLACSSKMLLNFVLLF
jgi:hypothetical protein